MKPANKIAIIGVGNELHGDDGIGVLLARQLKNTLTLPQFLVLEGGLAPENVLGKLRQFQPQVVVLIDAVLNLGESGEIYWLTPNEAQGFSASSHTLPLSMLASFINAEYQAEVFILAIQAELLAENKPLSTNVEEACHEILSCFSDN